MPVLRGMASYKQAGIVGSRQHSPHSTFAHFTEPMSATLADRCELTCPPSAFAAFQGHFSSTFAASSSLSKKIILATYGETAFRNLVRRSRSQLRRLVTNPKLSVLSLFFCQRP